MALAEGAPGANGLNHRMEATVTDGEEAVTGGQLRFVDLFAGLGGFHLALRNLGHTCVFASELDETLRDTYYENFGIRPAGDIRDVNVADIPSHDILCAGFPCQPFSKARDHSGPRNTELSELHVQILRVINHHHPQYLILENVPNFEKHDDGQTWETVKELLQDAGYIVRHKRLSPHEFGIPQVRQRIYIVGSRSSLEGFQWPARTHSEVSMDTVLDSSPAEARQIPAQVERCIDLWQEFLDIIPRNEKIPHPLWSMEFGATYPYERATPWGTPEDALRFYKGSYGSSLHLAATKEEILALLPSHARTNQAEFPGWKKRFIEKNRVFYFKHKERLHNWIDKTRQFPSSFQKLEWNCQEKDPRDEIRQIREYIIQVRASGVRVKRRTSAPSLVAMTSTQVPIIGWERRYMTPMECKRLQSMEGLKLPYSDTRAYAALGNAINVQVGQRVAEALLGTHGVQLPHSPSKHTWRHAPEPVELPQTDDAPASLLVSAGTGHGEEYP